VLMEAWVRVRVMGQCRKEGQRWGCFRLGLGLGLGLRLRLGIGLGLGLGGSRYREGSAGAAGV
jgi:hypothetical protein